MVAEDNVDVMESSDSDEEFPPDTSQVLTLLPRLLVEHHLADRHFVDTHNLMTVGHSIESKSLSETTICPQTFIVKTLIIANMNSHHIYMKQKEGAREHDTGETVKESA
jgi:hypothetical protein